MGERKQFCTRHHKLWMKTKSNEMFIQFGRCVLLGASRTSCLINKVKSGIKLVKFLIHMNLDKMRRSIRISSGGSCDRNVVNCDK